MFAQKHRLTKTKEIDQVFKKSRSVFLNNLGIKVLVNKLGYLRLSVLVSTKVSKKAVERNLLKRRIKAVLKKHLDENKTSVDMIVLTKPENKQLDFSELEKTITQILKKHKLI